MKNIGENAISPSSKTKGSTFKTYDFEFICVNNDLYRGSVPNTMGELTSYSLRNSNMINVAYE